jgi:hypothetical protein
VGVRREARRQLKRFPEQVRALEYLGGTQSARTLDPMTATTIAQRAVELTHQGISRDDAIADLVELADGRRGPLETAAHDFVQRLHRHSDDFEATKALRLVTAALGRVGWDTTGQPRLTSASPGSAVTASHPRRRGSRRRSPARPEP